jgi:hypothetical protein
MTALVDLGKWTNSFETEWNSNFNAGGNATDSDSSEDESEDRRALAQQVATMMKHHQENDEKKRQKKMGQKRKAYREDFSDRIEKSEDREKVRRTGASRAWRRVSRDFSHIVSASLPRPGLGVQSARRGGTKRLRRS